MNEDRSKIIGFYHEYEEYGCFSNWYPADFDYAGRHYAHCEQYMMAQKVVTALLLRNYFVTTALLHSTSTVEA